MTSLRTAWATTTGTSARSTRTGTCSRPCHGTCPTAGMRSAARSSPMRSRSPREAQEIAKREGFETYYALRKIIKDNSYEISSKEAFEEKATEKGLPENYILSSTDLSAYEESIAPLETLSTMTGWFFVIVLIIGGIILVVLNIFNLRERKYEVGVLTAIGMKKSKVALQFVCELFIITFTAIIIGTGSGAVMSVPVTNSLLESQIEKVQEADDEVAQNFGMQGRGDKQSFNRGGCANMNQKTEVNYIDSVSSATDFTVIIQLVLVGLLLTIISSLAALITIMRYEPLKILSSRT